MQYLCLRLDTCMETDGAQSVLCIQSRTKGAVPPVVGQCSQKHDTFLGEAICVAEKF